MNRPVIDGILKDWGERLYYEPLKGRKGRNIRSGVSASRQAVPKLSASTTREKVARTVTNAPEVMVKISGGGKNMKHIKAHMDYISRNGNVAIEDEKGDVYLGIDEVRDVRDAWAKGKIGIPESGEKRKEAFNIVLSMPPGTDREAVKNAARTFATEEFNSHQYVFAAHEDEKHPHVHLVVKAIGDQGVRLNPRKADLMRWREQFAEHLRAHGVEANATARNTRGIILKPEKQMIRHINAEYEEGNRNAPARVTAVQKLEAEREAIAGLQHINPNHEIGDASRKEILKSYGQIARAFAGGDNEDKKLALQIMQFVKQMPTMETQHQTSVEDKKMKSPEAVRKGEMPDPAVEQVRTDVGKDKAR